MNGTPRLRSAFPSTPRSTPKWTPPTAGASNSPQKSPNLEGPKATQLDAKADGPLIPLSILDAPTQRFYIAAFYICLNAWRLLDFSQLLSTETESLWFFMKWVAIDGAFLYGVPGLRIPWLEWSSSTMTGMFLLHASINAVMMFRIPIPFQAWIIAFTRMIYDRELAVSEKRVKPASLLDNSSLISGKQIVHILPEGSAMLNPNQQPFCIDIPRKPLSLPILINQTVPISLELLRIDLDTNANETIIFSSKELKKLKKQADREFAKNDLTGPRLLQLPIKQAGLYRLLKVVDESHLEVQRKTSDTLVVSCPTGSIKTVNSNKCRGDLSDFYLQVDATPPLKVKYSKSVDKEDQSHVFLTVNPENNDTPLTQQRVSGAIVKTEQGEIDVSWARTRHIEIPINETFGFGSSWVYSLEEIHDGCGNVMKYPGAEETAGSWGSKDQALQQLFIVHERPRALLEGCNQQEPLKVARGKSRQLPIRFNRAGQHNSREQKHFISYSFLSNQHTHNDGESRFQEQIENIVIPANGKGPEISEPGLYSLTSVSSEFCNGEVLEPSSCILSNPPEPDLMITSESIPHQCEGNSIGLRVGLDFIGTPPFEISYSINQKGGSKIVKTENVNEMRTQLEFKPRDAGHYVYEFLDIADAVYRTPRSVKQANLRLEQDVKPTAWAMFMPRTPQPKTCIQEAAAFDLQLSGEAPWSVDYDIVHNGKRTKHKEENIMEAYYTLVTPKLQEGGQYSLSLTSVADASGCSIHLKEEAKVDVRHQRPSVGFGLIEGRRSASSLEGKKVDIPLRLSGEPPWTITYSRTGAPGQVFKKRVNAVNDVLSAEAQDIYRLEEVADRFCPGSVDSKTDQFEIQWIPRPTVQLADSSTIEAIGGIFHKKAVCEGDQDLMELLFTGQPPYSIKYDVHMKPGRGSASVSSKHDSFGLQSANIRMDTSKAGVYEYRVAEFGDQRYSRSSGNTQSLSIRQKVNNRPSASFLSSGKTYNYCKEDAVGDEVIPIALTGQPPFSIEINIKHHAASSPETLHIPNIEGMRYDFHIPHSALSLGLHTVYIRKVNDANGCQRDMEHSSPFTRVSVVDVPSISPMETNTNFCVGDRISYTLAGTPPFNVYYTFEGVERKASISSNSFKRLAEKPGNFTITAISDKASTDSCRARTSHTKIIHGLPSVRISKGRTTELDIHEGGEAEIVFEFEGTPPFEFTWTRSTNEAKGKRPRILETKTDMSPEHSKIIQVSEEGTYEVVSIRDRYCGVSTQKKIQAEQQLLAFN